MPGFLLVMLMGLGLHLATDVYNDIYNGNSNNYNDTINVYTNTLSM